MRLKECFKIQNFYDIVLSDLMIAITDADNRTNTLRVHKLSEIFNEQDKTTDESPKTAYNCSFDDLVLTYLTILGEKYLLGKAIIQGMNSIDFEMNNEVSSNKKKAYFNSVLKSIYAKDLPVVEQKSTLKTNRINNDGNQTVFEYPIVNIKTLTYEKSNLKDIIKNLTDECDRTSMMIEENLLKDCVEYTMPFDIDLNDTIEEIIEKIVTV